MTTAKSLAAGLPAVATDVGGVRDVVEDGHTGFVVPPGDLDAVAAALSRLAREPDTRAELAGAARIALRITGRDQSAYIAHKVEEALRDSAVRVSLAAHRDGSVAGFITAKVDFGDFGRTEPVAVIDTIAVDPGFVRAGVGSALMSQLFVNLQALQVERVETVVERERLDLLAFFHRMGFAPSERLGFVKQLKS
jgi:GNAT superfamily N-acetyltransferase